MALTTRLAEHVDLPALKAIWDYADEYHQQALPEVFRPREGGHRTQAFLKACIEQADSAVLLAELDGAPVGLCYVLERASPDVSLFVPRRYAVVDTLAVLPLAQRRGIGRALLKRAEGWARDRGLDEIELGVYEFNTGARALYEGAGYDTLRRAMHRRLTAAEGDRDAPGGDV